MDKKPTRYYLSYEDAALVVKELKRVQGVAEDMAPDAIYRDEDAADTLNAAIRMARKRAKEHDTSVCIYERYNIRQEPISDEFDWLYDWVWDYDKNEVVADITRGKLTTYEAA